MWENCGIMILQKGTSSLLFDFWENGEYCLYYVNSNNFKKVHRNT